MVKLKLTNREKILLIIAAICLVSAILYYLVIKPQLDTVDRLEEQAKKYSQTIADIKTKTDPNNIVYKEYQDLNEKTQKLLFKYYPAIIQENIILLLDEKLKKANVEVVSMAFSEPALADLKQSGSEQLSQISELDDLVKQLYSNKTAKSKKEESNNSKVAKPIKVEKMTAALSLQGSYSQIYSFIKEIELENRSIIFSNINIINNFNNILTCDLTLDFYSIPKPFVQERDNIEWDIKGVYGKETPF